MSLKGPDEIWFLMTENKNITIQKEEPDLYKRSIKGGYWVTVINVITQILGFAKSIIIFNFLFHNNLELIIVANLLMTILVSSTESGFQAALIQKRESIEEYLDTAWVIGILRGILLYTLVYFMAPLIVLVKVAPESSPLAIAVIRTIGIVFLIHAFGNVGIVKFNKELQFHKTFFLTIAGTLTDIVLSITLVLVYQSVWAYVAARLASAVVNLIMSYLLCSYRPRFHFIPKKAREMWKYGKWLFGGNIVGYLLSEGDDWFVWFFLGAEPLKLYRYAFRFSNMPVTHVTRTISQVSFPAYSKIQQDLPRLRNAYFKVLQVTAITSIPIAFLIFALGPDFIRLFLVEESHGMIPVVQILSFYGLLKSLGATRGPLFRAVGQPQTTWKLHCAGLILLCILIYPLTQIWGIIGTAVATSLMILFVNSIGIHKAKHILQCSIWDLRKPTYVPFVSSLFMYGIVAALRGIGDMQSFLSFASLLIISLFSYFFALWIMDSVCPSGIRAIIMEPFVKQKCILHRKN